MEEAFEKQCTIGLRRSERQRKLNERGRKDSQLATQSASVFSSESESELEDLDGKEKPSVLHDNDLPGERIFTFQKRKKCETVVEKPKSKSVPKTPHALRQRMQKKIQDQIIEETSGSDFSDSGSEYVASDEDPETESSASDASTTSNEPSLKPRTKAMHTVADPNSLSQFPKPNTKRMNKNYTIKTDEYFSNHSSKKIVTSNHTLDKLETPRLPQDRLHTILAELALSSEHDDATKKLLKQANRDFHKWFYLLHENMNILLYGLGSKKEILDAFRNEYLKNLPTVVINGFFPTLSIKDILDSIIKHVLDLKESPANVFEASDLIAKEFSYIPETHLYLVVHNIDMLRSSKAQNIFARLACNKNIHLIASIDHINGPLIWDHSKLSKFNFIWYDTTTFQPYIDETSFESSMMIQKTGTLALSSLRNVFLSLTKNSKGIFTTLAKYQMEHSKSQYYQGLPFRDLYSMCREAFLVSSDLALRAQLQEFLDHKMLKIKRTFDGGEYLTIPVSNTLLQQFFNEQSD